jgi:hypothetical protein
MMRKKAISLSTPARLAGLVTLALIACDAPGDQVPPSEASEETSPGDQVIPEVLVHLDYVEERLNALADEFTAAQYAWRPAEGVRSTGEALMHVAAINFAFPMLTGYPGSPSTGMTSIEGLPTAFPAYEERAGTKNEIAGEVRASFEYLRAAVEATADGSSDRPVDVFGESATVRSFWFRHLGHIQEHLGQLIAYARMNGVVPPWSQ